MAEDFPVAPLSLLQYQGRFVHPRVKITGKVIYKRSQSDGDYHIIVGPKDVDNSVNTITGIEEMGLPYVVCEQIPEIILTTEPVLHSIIDIWGIYRWDIEHGWPEIHPILGWAPVSG